MIPADLSLDWRTLDYAQMKVLQAYVAVRMLELTDQIEHAPDRSTERKLMVTMGNLASVSMALSTCLKHEGIGAGA